MGAGPSGPASSLSGPYQVSGDTLPRKGGPDGDEEGARARPAPRCHQGSDHGPQMAGFLAPPYSTLSVASNGRAGASSLTEVVAAGIKECSARPSDRNLRRSRSWSGSSPGGRAADTLAPRCFGRMRLASLTRSDQRRVGISSGPDLTQRGPRRRHPAAPREV
jgi:hypothetical protein